MGRTKAGERRKEIDILVKNLCREIGNIRKRDRYFTHNAKNIYDENIRGT